jgi:hypothetical protein
LVNQIPEPPEEKQRKRGLPKQSSQCRRYSSRKLHFFGEARQTSVSHRIYKTPWQGDPRVNIQNDKGMAKAYQVRQVLKAMDRLTASGGDMEEQDNVTK